MLRSQLHRMWDHILADHSQSFRESYTLCCDLLTAAVHLRRQKRMQQNMLRLYKPAAAGQLRQLRRTCSPAFESVKAPQARIVIAPSATAKSSGPSSKLNTNDNKGKRLQKREIEEEEEFEDFDEDFVDEDEDWEDEEDEEPKASTSGRQQPPQQITRPGAPAQLPPVAKLQYEEVGFCMAFRLAWVLHGCCWQVACCGNTESITDWIMQHLYSYPPEPDVTSSYLNWFVCCHCGTDGTHTPQLLQQPPIPVNLSTYNPCTCNTSKLVPRNFCSTSAVPAHHLYPDEFGFVRGFSPYDQGEFVELGTIVSAHGIRGEVKVEISTDDPKKRFGQAGNRYGACLCNFHKHMACTMKL